ncbi:MAG: phosphopyruvate hydratase [Acidilobaceae archaeon]
MEELEISKVLGLLALDSRGSPTVKALVRTKGGAEGWAIAPSGASKSAKEAVELRDGGRKWVGKGVSIALARLNDIVAPRLIGVNATNQALVDAILVALDGTENKSRLGGNVTTAVSLAVARAAASQLKLPLYKYLGGVSARVMPAPLLNVINGGAHAGNELSFQEFLIIPVGSDSFREALRIAVEVYWELKKLLKERYGSSAINVGDEGGFAPPMKKVEEALNSLVEAVKRAGYSENSDFFLGIDVAASQLKGDKGYLIDEKVFEREELIEFYADLVSRYPIAYIEDPLSEDDFEGFAELVKKLGKRVLVCGDDLYATRADRLEAGLKAKATTAALLKVNQVGTLTEAIEFAELAKSEGVKIVVSHRSGDSEDSFIADLAVALRAPLIKTGAPARGERTAKYNRLLEIEEELGPQAKYIGIRAIKA